MDVPGRPDAFRGSDAVAAGLVTPALLRGPSFDRLLPDVYGRDATGSATTLARRLPVGWPGRRAVRVLGGRAARAVLRATRRTGRGDRGRWRPVPEGSAGLLHFTVRYAGVRWVRNVVDVLSLADARSGSPPETRLRLLLTRAGLPRPAVQYPVLDDDRCRAVWLDLAYPHHRLGVEYDGGDHLEPARVLRDIDRHTRLVAAGWRVLRYTAEQMRHEPHRIVADVAAGLGLDPRTLRPF